MKKLFISIAGQAGTGKSCVAHLIKSVLMDHGIGATVNDDDDSNFSWEERVESLKGGVDIEVTTVQTTRHLGK